MAYTTIDDPSAYFHTQLYTGTGSALSITNDANAGDFKPDWIWLKSRNNATNHNVFDSSRGETKRLYPNLTDAEDTVSGFTLDSDGFSTGTSSVGDINVSAKTYVAWQWKANGGTTTSVSATGTAHESTMAGTHQANTTAGFSIVTFSTASEDLGDKLITHGIGKKPEWIIIKSRSSGDWYCHHISANTNDSKYIRLNLSNAPSDSGSRNTFDTSNITTTQFAVDHNNIVADNHNHVAYVFAPIQGYSKFGSYTGNGNTDGPFVYTGFKPAWLMIKRTDASAEWHIWDNKREDYNGNPNNTALRANNNNAESDSTDYSIDFLSNGFKLRNASNLDNASSSTQVYMAFAEHPFVGSDGVPTTAR